MTTPSPSSDRPSVPPSDAVELSVVIAVRNGAETLAEQLDALVAQTWSGTWEVIVADNGSTDGTRQIAQRYAAVCPRVRLVDASAARGAGPARDVGMASAAGAAFAFCDADDVVQPGWVAALGTALRTAPFVAGRLRFDQLNPLPLQTAFYAAPPDGLETFAGIFPTAATCNLGVRRDIIDRIGGFDARFRTGQDLDLCRRLWQAGVELVEVPDAVVQYRYRQSLWGLGRRSMQYGRVGPRIARQLADAGLPTPPRWQGLRGWAWLIRHAGRLRTPAGRARWVVVAGGKVGRLVGSCRERRIYL